MKGYLLANATHAVTREVLSVFAPLLREEEQREAYREVAERVRQVLSGFEAKRQRMQRRLDPLGCGP